MRLFFINILCLYFCQIALCNEEEDTTKTSGEMNNEIGLALCGGIFVAAGGNAALMRGFQHQNVTLMGEERPAMEAFDSISSISGGSIPTMLYVYAQNVENSDQLLDSVGGHLPQDRDPSKITKESLSRSIHPKSIQYRFTCSVLQHVLPRMIFILPDVFTYGFRVFMSYLGLHTHYASTIWTLVMWKSLLSPFGIEKDHSFGSKQDDSTILARKGIKTEAIFCFALTGLVERGGGEFTRGYIESGRIAREKGYFNRFVTPKEILEILEETNNITFPPFVVSSTNVETRYNLPIKDLGNITHSMKHENWGTSAAEGRFSLEFVLALVTQFISFTVLLTAKKVDLATETQVELVKLANEYSQRRTININNKEDSFLFADGGFVEGVGVPPLVLKGTRHIIASLWIHDHPEQNYHKLYNTALNKDLNVWLRNTKAGGLGEIASYFGFMVDERRLLNHIFDDGEYHLQKLRETFDALYVAGMPLITTLKDLKVIENPFWGTQEGGVVDLTVIFYTLPTKFSSQIPIDAVPPPPNKSMVELGSFTNEEFKEFPNFGGYLDGVANVKTGYPLWDILYIGTLSTKQMNMMNYYASWMVNEAWNGLYVDGVEMFGGFSNIFSKKTSVESFKTSRIYNNSPKDSVSQKEEL